MFPITVVNAHHGKSGEYIGRGSPLGNPFSHIEGTKAIYKVKSREEAITCYESWIKHMLIIGDQPVKRELNRLTELSKKGHLKLVCYCAPKPCHGDIIKKIIEEARGKE